MGGMTGRCFLGDLGDLGAKQFLVQSHMAEDEASWFWRGRKNPCILSENPIPSPPTRLEGGVRLSWCEGFSTPDWVTRGVGFRRRCGAGRAAEGRGDPLQQGENAPSPFP